MISRSFIAFPSDSLRERPGLTGTCENEVGFFRLMMQMRMDLEFFLYLQIRRAQYLALNRHTRVIITLVVCLELF